MTKDTSAEGQFTEEEKRHNRSRLVAANIPAIVYEQGMSSFSPTSDRVREYLQSGAYKEDLFEKRGIYLWGTNAKRSDIFAIIAKILVLNDIPVYFTNLHNLVGIIEHDAEKKNYLGRVGHLFIDNIQKRYTTHPDDCPYQRYTMSDVEDLLEYRRTHSHITHMSSSIELDKLTWLGKDTIEQYRSILTPINV